MIKPLATIALGIVATGLTACASGDQPGLLGQTPIETHTYERDYQQLASCAYQRLDKTAGTGIKKIDLPNQSISRLALESGGVRYWELIFTAIGRNRTRVDFSVVATMWGPDRLSTRGIMPEVAACAAV